MTSYIFYIYGFSLLFFRNVYAEYWNETEFLNVNRRDSRRIRNKLVTFDTTDTDIEVAFQFNVPFVAVPSRSAGNIQNSVASFVNLNLGSVALAAVMIAFGSLGSFLWTLFLPNSRTNSIKYENTDTANSTTTTDSTGATSDTESIDGTESTTGASDTESTAGASDTESTGATGEEKSRKTNRAKEKSQLWDFIDLLDATINPTVCVQQYICSLRKLSAKNVAEGCAASSDKIIAGIFEARWILDIISGTAIHDAIEFGESRSDCDKRFSKCGFESMRPEDMSTILLKILRVFAS